MFSAYKDAVLFTVENILEVVCRERAVHITSVRFTSFLVQISTEKRPIIRFGSSQDSRCIGSITYFFSLPTRPRPPPPQGFSAPQKNAIKCSIERILLNRRINSQLLLCSSASAHSNELDYRSGSILLSIGFLGLKSIWNSRGRGKRFLGSFLSFLFT